MTRSETDDMPMAGGHYSHGLRAGDFVYTAGQVPRDSGRNVIGITIEERDVPVGALRDAGEAFVTSTVREVQPITAVDGHPLPAAPGPKRQNVTVPIAAA